MAVYRMHANISHGLYISFFIISYRCTILQSVSAEASSGTKLSLLSISSFFPHVQLFVDVCQLILSHGHHKVVVVL